MIELPRIVQRMTEAVSLRLGRPAYHRKVKNHNEWFVSYPVFSFVQHGMKKGLTGYRVGYWIDLSDEPHDVTFCLVHSPLMARLFKHNLVLSSLMDVIQRTSEFRSSHWLYRSSRVAQRTGEDGDRLEGASAAELIAHIQDFDEAHGFVKDLFPRTWNRGRKGVSGPSAKAAGNTFYLPLCDQIKLLDSRAAVTRLVESSWPLFLCLYPIKAIEVRTAHIARSLRDKKIPRVCEFREIKLPAGLPKDRINPLCRGELQGAHIIPDSRGGTDRAENGLWLCEYHHQMTEGHLAGRRNGIALNVRYVL